MTPSERPKLRKDENISKQSSRYIMGFERQDFTGDIQRWRGKENVRYVNGSEVLFAKYVDLQGQGIDNIEGLRKEKHFLDLLSDSLVTPKPHELKIYPNEQRARLTMGEIPGVSLDKIDTRLNLKFLIERAEDLVISTAFFCLRSIKEVCCW